jgi:hypothetical protein
MEKKKEFEIKKKSFEDFKKVRRKEDEEKEDLESSLNELKKRVTGRKNLSEKDSVVIMFRGLSLRVHKDLKVGSDNSFFDEEMVEMG